jgi:hypothetical protein
MKRSRVLLIAGAGVVVAGLVGGGIWLATRPATADDAAARYLGALASGDAGALRSVLADADGVPEETWSLFENASGRIGSAEVISLEVSGEQASATARFALGDETHELGFGLVHAGEEGWRVVPDPLPAYRVTAALGSSIRVGDAVVPLGPDDEEPADGLAEEDTPDEGASESEGPEADGDALPDDTAELVLLPAEYTIAPFPGEYLEGEARLLAGADDATEPVELDASLTSRAQEDAEAQLAAHIEACTQPATEVEEGCGLVVPWPADLTTATSVEYRVDAAPTAEVDIAQRTFQATGGAVVVTVHGIAPDGSEAERTYRTDDWSLYGDLSVDDEGLLLSVF